MSKSIFKWILFLSIFAALAGMVAIGLLFFYRLAFVNKEKIDAATPPDVRFVLDACHLDESRMEKVVHSYQSTRSFSGGHFDAYEIKVTNITVDELTKANDIRWQRGDQLSRAAADAIQFAGIWLNEDRVSWFPRESELKSDAVYVDPRAIEYVGDRPRSAQLIFVKPSENMVFYFDAKM